MVAGPPPPLCHYQQHQETRVSAGTATREALNDKRIIADEQRLGGPATRRSCVDSVGVLLRDSEHTSWLLLVYSGLLPLLLPLDRYLKVPLH